MSHEDFDKYLELKPKGEVIAEALDLIPIGFDPGIVFRAEGLSGVRRERIDMPEWFVDRLYDYIQHNNKIISSTIL